MSKIRVDLDQMPHFNQVYTFSLGQFVRILIESTIGYQIDPTPTEILNLLLNGPRHTKTCLRAYTDSEGQISLRIHHYFWGIKS